MSDQEKYWYQDGSVVVFVGLGVLWLAGTMYNYRQSQMPVAFPRVSGRLEQPLFGNPVLHISVHHQTPGDLRNGQLIVATESEMVAERDSFHVYSFETWPPNKQNAQTFEFPLQRFDPGQEIPLKVSLSAANAKKFSYRPAWLGFDWKSNQEQDSVSLH